MLATFAYAAVYSAVGEALGMTLGAGQSPLQDWRNELDRRKVVGPEDQHLLLPTTPAGDHERVTGTRRSRNDPVRIGVIGCGSVALSVHLPILTRLRDATVVAVADSLAPARTAALKCQLRPPAPTNTPTS